MVKLYRSRDYNNRLQQPGCYCYGVLGFGLEFGSQYNLEMGNLDLW